VLAALGPEGPGHDRTPPGSPLGSDRPILRGHGCGWGHVGATVVWDAGLSFGGSCLWLHFLELRLGRLGGLLGGLLSGLLEGLVRVVGRGALHLLVLNLHLQLHLQQGHVLCLQSRVPRLLPLLLLVLLRQMEQLLAVPQVKEGPARSVQLSQVELGKDSRRQHPQTLAVQGGDARRAGLAGSVGGARQSGG